ncbi:rod shape-determining protein MreD [Aestuariirhabdus litorea]|uniref:Rod shape-determining protein MreD n=1 Tax=Aestuariirhabdus litorea TaxID=2528527 RepID=A0A3P3VP64_9GAMM|nr:rod shape-determining protein MreD [Aestuariirhabdus litorea]RRJ83708.1 rod shape-determining protein MreD [Aestuariirhabdus litorea]RWW96930.1 rod shape-determining protein MreD [Endozoicomonadaceae bacterium GTF-13]
MSEQRPRGGMVILLSFVAALLLAVIPLPGWGVLVRPEWVALVAIYWVLALPERIGVGWAWSAGLMLDVIQGTLLGQNALGMVVVAYIMMRLHRRMRMFPLPQQSLIVFVAIGLYQMVALWVRSVTGAVAPDLSFLLPAISSAVIWPWLFLILRDLRRRFRIN